MRRLILLAVLVLGLAACGGSGKQNGPVKITFGREGGLIAPYSITIAPGGAVTTTGSPPATPASLTSAQDLLVSNQVRDGIGKLKSESCPGDFPDEASFFITALGKTVTVRGNCEQGFTDLFNALTTAVGPHL